MPRADCLHVTGSFNFKRELYSSEISGGTLTIDPEVRRWKNKNFKVLFINYSLHAPFFFFCSPFRCDVALRFMPLISMKPAPTCLSGGIGGGFIANACTRVSYLAEIALSRGSRFRAAYILRGEERPHKKFIKAAVREYTGRATGETLYRSL